MGIVGGLKHITEFGDTFDILALDYYNDEFLAGIIIDANPKYSGVIIFESGIELTIPIIEQSAAATLPPWKR